MGSKHAKSDAERRDRIKASRAKYYAANREEILRKQKARRDANLFVTRELNRASRNRAKESRAASARRYRTENPEVVRDAYRKSVYGVPEGWYAMQFEIQGGRCALCAKHGKRLCIDHCHASGRVRGLLCTACNTAVGVMERYRDSIGAMLEYADNAASDAQLRACQAVILADRAKP